MLDTPSFSYINIPHAIMRNLPDSTSLVVSDAPYSEEVIVLRKENGWSYIKTKNDSYNGWVESGSVVSHKKDFFQGGSVAKVHGLMVYLYSTADTERGAITSLPFGSRLKIQEEIDSRWLKVIQLDDTVAYIQRGDVTTDLRKLSLKEMLAFCPTFVGTPYLWGGRSSYGYDCSGFIQMLFKEMGVFLPRDSKDQLACNRFTTIEVTEVTPGDLIFWGSAADKIRHVGLYLGRGRFIHSTVRESQPFVHISKLKDKDWNGTGTLTFRAARRLKQEAPKKAASKPYIFMAAISIALNVAHRILFSRD